MVNAPFLNLIKHDVDCNKTQLMEQVLIFEVHTIVYTQKYYNNMGYYVFLCLATDVHSTSESKIMVTIACWLKDELNHCGGNLIMKATVISVETMIATYYNLK